MAGEPRVCSVCAVTILEFRRKVCDACQREKHRECCRRFRIRHASDPKPKGPSAAPSCRICGMPRNDGFRGARCSPCSTRLRVERQRERRAEAQAKRESGRSSDPCPPRRVTTPMICFPTHQSSTDLGEEEDRYQLEEAEAKEYLVLLRDEETARDIINGNYDDMSIVTAMSILGIDIVNTSSQLIRQRYHDLSLLHHPDKGCNTSVSMATINTAWRKIRRFRRDL